MTDIRRSILWVVFGFSMVMLWDNWQLYNGNEPTFFAAPKPAATAAAVDPNGPAAAPGVGGSAASLPGASAATAVAGERVTVQSDVLSLVFDSQGASLVGATLRQHATQLGGANANFEPLVLLQNSPQSTYIAQSGLTGVGGANHTTLFTRQPGPTTLADGQDQLQVRYVAQAQNGVSLETTYTISRGSYVIDVQHRVSNTTAQPVTPQVYLQLVRDDTPAESETPFYQTFTGPAVYTEEKKFQKIDFEDLAKREADFQKQTRSGYVAMVQHYFASAWLLPEGTSRTNYARPTGGRLYAVGTLADLPPVAPGAEQRLNSRLFVGPQDEKNLEQIAPGLELVKDYGWVTILAKPLYWLLEQIHAVVGNWGWAIVLLVVVIKAAFYWLNAKAYRSMAKMKALTPRITEMRERLKEQPQQMQQEMMRIYREEKVNPLGGCLPIMVQIPVFIALYWVLLSSVEMRNAPWLGWIHDLSSKDPWFILPVIMTATTLFQTALSPLPPDPLQAKLMWFMPLAFSVMFFFFPAGLVLYWITNNSLTIAQQYVINRSMGVKVSFNLPKFK
ncbi:MAG: membrane protein insertase YidC [Proteobacteria bacterium]|nr:membrane protein insertase YidC [Pseudomonadota bacterium]MDA0869862.1 membrane protein insertase YidC [Pseudomonadota bacterium]MDA1329209.1 membrane protein insertase YidC [Pseudomonadota bacterium]